MVLTYGQFVLLDGLVTGEREPTASTSLQGRRCARITDAETESAYQVHFQSLVGLWMYLEWQSLARLGEGEGEPWFLGYGEWLRILNGVGYEVKGEPS